MPSLLPISPRGAFRDAALFRPRSVAFLADPASAEASVVARNLAAGGFQGRLFAVGAPAAVGLEPAASVAELPVAPDLAVLCLPAAALEPAMAALAARGCFAAVVPGPAPDLGAASARTGVRALGQGSFGLCVPGIGLNASLAHVAPRPGRLALVGQSGAIARAVLDWAEAEGVGFSHLVGLGANAGNAGFAVALDWLSRDAGTGAVLLDLRRVRDRRAFVSAARAAARTRPVVALRPGARAADPAGVADAVMAAALRRAGVLSAAGLGDLLAAAETLARARLRPGASDGGDRVAVVADGMGPALLAADAVAAGGGRLAALSPEALTALDALLPEGWRAGNPLSLGPAAGPRLAEAAAALAALPEVDSVVALHAPSPDPAADAVAADALVAAARARGGAGGRAAPVLVGWTGEATGAARRRALADAGLAAFRSPEAAVRGALHLAHDRAARAAAAELPPREVLDLRPDRAAATAILAAARAAGRLRLTAEEALGLLAAYGVPTAPGRRGAPTPGDAADAAAALGGWPVVLKALGPDLPRKAEVGGVRLGLDSPAAVREAATAMLRRVAARRPGAVVDGFLVQRQAAAPAAALRLRLGEDAMFGPWIGIGPGGAMAALGGEAHDLPPLNLALGRALVGRSRAVAALLDGAGGGAPPADRDAVAGVLVRLSQLAVDLPEVAAATVDPLFADARGVLAVDAAVTLRPLGAPAPVLAVPPYPAELVRRFRTRGGEALTVRPIRPEDAEALAEAFAAVPPEDVRYRFFSPIRALAPGMVARLTQIDYDREMALVAVRPAPAGAAAAEEIVGVARLIRAPGTGDEAEFALIVGPPMKGQGLGRHLMERLLDWARARGVRRVRGDVLADNAPMIAFSRALGFAVRRPAAAEAGDDVLEARLDLG